MDERRYYIIEKKAEPEDYLGASYAESLEKLPGEEEDLTPHLPGVVQKLRAMTLEEVEKVLARAHVERVVEDFTVHADKEPVVSASSSRVSAEAARRFHNVHLAHEAGYKGRGAKIATLDTGIDEVHAQNLGPLLVAKESVVGGEDWRDTQSGHGTWCLGCAHEIAPEAQLISIKVLSTSTGSGSGSGIIRSINRAVELGATQINLSLGGDGNPDDPMCRAVDAAERAGVFVSSAAGNDQDDNPGRMNADFHHTGCSREGTCVPGVDSDSALARFSNWGVSNDVAAIGVLTEGWGLNGGKGRAMSGTSMATPHITGIAALGTSTGNGKDVVKKALYGTARDTGLPQTQEGHGIADAYAMVLSLAGEQRPVPAPAPEPAPTPAPEVPIDPGHPGRPQPPKKKGFCERLPEWARRYFRQCQ